MALKDNLCSPNDASSLLTFINATSSNIQELALGNKTKRKVNHRKFIQKRVKRLTNGPAKRATTTSKPSAQLNKPCEDAALTSPTLLAHLSTHWFSPPTSTYPTLPPTPCLEPELSLYPSPCQPKAIDPELESLLEFLDSPVGAVSPHGSEPSLTYQPAQTLESQVAIGEHPFSPYSQYSDCSDEHFDSAYGSPVNSVQGYGSPAYRCVMNGEWEANQTLPQDVFTQVDQGPPLTPTISQIWDPFGLY